MGNLTGKNVRVREGKWHFRFNLNKEEQSGSTGLEGIASNQKSAEIFAENERKRLLKESRRAVPVGFDGVAGEFIAWCRAVEYRSKPNTAGRIATSFVSAVRFFRSMPVQEIDPAAIEGYKAYRITNDGVRDITLRHDLHALSVFFKKYAIKMGLAKSNPIDGVTIPSDKDAVRDHVVTPEEEDRYFAAAYELHAKHLKSHPGALPNVADIARLILEQGCRPEEIMTLRKEAFEPKALTLRIEGGKTRAARRTLNLTAVSVSILERRLKLDGPWLFPSDRNQGQHMTKLSCTHDRICQNARVAFTIYDFRHTFATRQIEDGNPVAIVASILGHSSLRTIHRYVHPTGAGQKAAMQKYEAAQMRRKLKVVG